MHQSSYNIVLQFRNLVLKHFNSAKIKLLDVGSYGVNGTYKEIFSDKKQFIYLGMDVQQGPNVDYVPEDPYAWLELEDESFDVIISGQAFEHIEFPWLIFEEVTRKLKKNGLVCIVAPSRGPEHKYPVDCWRYYPDGFRALAKWTGLTVLEAKTNWGASGFSDGSDQWGDSFCILYKGKDPSPVHLRPAWKTGRPQGSNKNNPLRADKQASYYAYARNEVIDVVVKNSIPAKRVLEIGCAGGAMGKKLKETVPVDHYIGIEISEQAAAIARNHLDEVFVADIEQADLKNFGLQEDDFDLVLLLDVLEHLYNPWDVLAGLTKYLKPGGQVVASIPNIQNIAIVNDLIKGKWRYEDAGILDATHLRFFTLEEIVRLFSGAGLTITSTNCILNPHIDIAALKETDNQFNQENLSIAHLTRDEVIRFYTYQYLTIARKTAECFGSQISPKETGRSVSVSNVYSPDSATSETEREGLFKTTTFEKKQWTEDLISIVILTFNQLKYTKECLESIRKWTPEPHEIIFVDNGSTDGTVKWIKKLVKENPHYTLIQNPKNLGFSKGCNQGIETSSGEFILLLNNDVVVTEGWLSGLLECLKSTQEAGIVGPMTNNISGPQQIATSDYTGIHQLHAYARSFREKNRYRRIPLRRIVGFCMLFRRSLVEKIGLLDESFGTGNFEDDDFCLRSSLDGYVNLIAGDVFIHHFGSSSFAGNKIDYKSALQGNKKIYDEKWRNISAATLLGEKVAVYNALDRAMEHSARGELDKAIPKLIKGLEYSPLAPAIYYFLAEILIEAKLFKDALEALIAMPEEEKNESRWLVLTGYCQEGLELLDEAADLADRALLLTPGYALALNLTGLITYKRGELDKARQWFEKAIAADPGYGEPYTNLGVLKWNQDKKSEGLDSFEKGYILDPTVSDIATLYHTAAVSLGELARAEKTTREAKLLHPLNKGLALTLIDLLTRQAHYDEALLEIERAIILFGVEDHLLTLGLDIRSKVGALEINTVKKDKKSISLCMIVKNEEPCLPKCLMSVQPIVHEIIVVDTGSSDRTKDLAALFGAKVCDFAWTGDFSEARNFSLSKASGDWILVLDADEVVSAQDYGLLRNFIDKHYPKPVAYAVATRNYTRIFLLADWMPNKGQYPLEEAGNGWCPSTKVRLFPRDSRIRFEGQVHELMEASIRKAGLEIRPCALIVHHYGKLDPTEVTTKGKDYYLMGKEKLAERPDDVKALYELASQAQELGQYDEAREMWERAVDLTKARPVPSFLMNLGYVYLKLAQYEKARSASQAALAAEPNMKEAALNYAYCELIIGDHKQAISLLKNILQKNPEYQPVIVLMAAAFAIEGDAMQAKVYLERSLKKGFINIPPLNILAEQLVSAGRRDQAKSLLETMIANNNYDQETMRLVEGCTKEKERAAKK